MNAKGTTPWGVREMHVRPSRSACVPDQSRHQCGLFPRTRPSAYLGQDRGQSPLPLQRAGIAGAPQCLTASSAGNTRPPTLLPCSGAR